MSEALIRLPEVIRRVGLSRAGIYARVARDEFPPPIKLGPRASAWVESEVGDWIAERVKAARIASAEAEQRVDV